MRATSRTGRGHGPTQSRAAPEARTELVGASLLAIAVFSFHADVEGKPGSPARTRRPPGSYRYGVKRAMSSHVGRIARQRYPPSHRRGLVGG
ncbi:hypothetical protein D9M69_722750 [compost metagenome]